MSDHSKFEIHHGGTISRLPAAITLHGEVFQTDPVIQYLCHGVPASKRPAVIPQFIGACLRSAALGSATFDEAFTSTTPPATDPASPPACSAVWVPPGKKVDSTGNMIRAGIVPVALQVGLTGLRAIFGDYLACAARAKDKGLVRRDGSKVGDQFAYLFFIATEEKERGKGLGAGVIRRFQGECKVPIWLEATTEGSQRLYARLGFEVVDEWVLGKGKVNREGLKEKGGEGVKVWGMIWWPEDQRN